VVNKTTGKEYTFKSLPPFLMKLMDAGGLVKYTKKSLKEKS